MPFVSRKNSQSIAIKLITREALQNQKKRSSEHDWLKTNGFEGKPGTTCFVPKPAQGQVRLFVGVKESKKLGDEIWDLAGLPKQLPKGRYHIESHLSPEKATKIATGWALGEYQFSKHKKHAKCEAELVWPANADRAEVNRLASGITITRDLINLPANDLGPLELADATKKIAKAYRASVTVIKGKELLTKNYPSVHAVGRASSRAPCLIDLQWGKRSSPKITLVGKGVCFDSGGLDIKPATGMLNMKKDMGGAAQVLGLAHMIMDAGLSIRLRVLIPAVENAISGDAFRPRDVLQTRKGITVEVGNTDAEGRLILSDALTEASKDKPEMIIDFATLTGAARVAVGTDLPALFCNNDKLAQKIIEFGLKNNDPVWRLPLWEGYKHLIESNVADLSSTGSTPFGGAITAALFLENFIEGNIPWAHIDLMAYNTRARPGRPEGGEAQAIRGLYAMLKAKFG